jgi:FAD/FMN-containing dehydrogenase
MPAGTATAIVACNTIDDVARVFATFERGAGGTLTAFEFMPRAIIECVLKNAPNTRDPFPATHAWYALVEITSADDAAAAESRMIALLSAASEASLITDARLATSLTQAKDLWRLRESVSEAQKPEGLSVKHDISVPIATIPAFVAKASALAQQLCPGARPWAFGHFGDGNVHYNVAQPVGMAPDAFRALMPKIMDATHDLVAEIAGSISAEHGIGQLKRTTLARVKSDVELDLMRAIKATLDPNGILNPGKLL